jgi:hypothetical protein
MAATLGLDLRAFKPPPALTGKNDWKEWRFRLINYMNLVATEYPEEIGLAENRTTPITLPEDETIRRRAVGLFTMLSQLVPSRGVRILQTVEDRNGYEGWRLLQQEFAPRIVQRKLVTLQHVLKPKLLSSSFLEG